MCERDICTECSGLGDDPRTGLRCPHCHGSCFEPRSEVDSDPPDEPGGWEP